MNRADWKALEVDVREAPSWFELLCIVSSVAHCTFDVDPEMKEYVRYTIAFPADGVILVGRVDLSNFDYKTQSSDDVMLLHVRQRLLELCKQQSHIPIDATN